MRLLVLGGTEFVGTAVVEDALARGWDVTVLNRGSHPAPPGVSVLRGDRTAPGGLGALAGAAGSWDIAVDTWSWAPVAVRDAAALLADRVGCFAYVSSRSVYAYPGVPGAAEDGPLLDGDPGDTEDGGLAGYNRMKRGGELAVLRAFGERRTLLARPGLILGPGENIGRLPWWLHRVARGGRVLAPGPADLETRFIDVRDLAAWLLDTAAAGAGGAYDVVCPPGHTTIAGLLEACMAATGSDAELVWTDPEPILAAGVRPWTGLPMWLPPGEMYDYVNGIDVTRALGAGLRVRPVADTAADTWAWLRGLDGPAPQRPDRPPVGIDPAVEAAILGQVSG
ncbi:reductase [Frankia sp. AgB1.9]|uniref:reductase n=1 Tax=unclassified Frankia TaxID=2632575 RepID=UPI0019322B3C|nr:MULTISPECIES: reductase [unclassified Frankia]MBL7492225.1 reductase [Frankia sp. AgW1.1]MBL7553565.1 reductase [Frankia sp. AgB1.9]MBL7623690.1 reductase [Frankia sp. AgB1.8]